MDLTEAGLEPDAEAMRELFGAAAERIIHYVSTLDAQRASDMNGVLELGRLVSEPMPEQGQPYEALLELLFDRLIPKGVSTNSPGMFSYVNGGALVHGAIADMITAATNPYVGYWGAAPGLAEIEYTVVRWLADMVGMPSSSRGVLLSGGSMANFSALFTARRILLGDEFRSGTIYASDQVHHSVHKAAILAGFPEHALRIVPSDDALRIRLEVLSDLVEQDRRAGRIPFCIVATAGTTHSGAVDDLESLADFARARGLWFHVDAAYGGCFALTERGKAMLKGIERADTVVLDPHKSMFMPFGIGCLLARDGELLRRAHQLHSDYIGSLVEVGSEAGVENFADLSPELSRGMRGLRIWLSVKLLGANVFRRALDEKLDLARIASERIAHMRGFELVAAPQLSILALRATQSGLAPEDQDRLNLRVLEQVNQRGRVHLSSTQIRGRLTLRICVLSLRTHEQALSTCLQELEDSRESCVRADA